MGYEILIRPKAQQDIERIFCWYEEKELGLGHYFILCLDASIEQLARFPTAYRIIRHEYRRFFVRKFPVGIFYIVRDQKVYVDAVESLIQDPERLDTKLRDSLTHPQQ